MGTEKGRIPHPKGGKPHHSARAEEHRAPRVALLVEALRHEVRRERGSVKRLMRWTGASERAVKAWLSGESQPRANHLISLMTHSDGICGAVLCAAGRSTALPVAEVLAVRLLMSEALERLVAVSPGP
jgi:hypothetical protein